MDLLLDDHRLGLRVGATTASDGDLHPTRVASDVLARRQIDLSGTRWAMAAQVHGTTMWHVDAVRSADRLVPADIVLLDRPARVNDGRSPSALAMWAADCATVVFVTDRALVGVHAGWRGLAAGAVQRGAATAAAVGPIESVVVGPLIGPCCYEFSEPDLHTVAAGVGTDDATIRGTTTGGAVALDVDAAVSAALDDVGLRSDVVADGCTGCADDGRRWFSHRARVDVGRHALVGWFV